MKSTWESKNNNFRIFTCPPCQVFSDFSRPNVIQISDWVWDLPSQLPAEHPCNWTLENSISIIIPSLLEKIWEWEMLPGIDLFQKLSFWNAGITWCCVCYWKNASLSYLICKFNFASYFLSDHAFLTSQKYKFCSFKLCELHCICQMLRKHITLCQLTGNHLKIF